MQEDDGYVCRVVEFPGLTARGPTASACEREGREALAALVASMLVQHQTPPQSRQALARRSQVNYRVTAEEMYILSTAAALTGQSITEYARAEAINAASRQVGGVNARQALGGA